MEKLYRTNLHLNIINTFILGVIWGLLEIFADAFIIPHNIFIKGLIFSFIAVIILIFSKQIINYRFSLLPVAAIALMLIFASKGFSINILIAIFSEALIAEIILLSIGNSNITSMAVGALIFVYSFIHGLLFHSSFPGSYINYQYLTSFYSLTGITVSMDAFIVVILFFGFISLVIGLLSGLLIFKFSNRYANIIENNIKTFTLSD